MISFIGKLVSANDEEVRAMAWATAYGFCILFGYYILRPVRDEISAADRGNLQILWTVVFLVMLMAVPLYSWVVSRYSRGVFIPLANRFFIANLLLFYVVLRFMPEGARPWIDRVFYVWVSVFALFVVTVFWGFVVDLFRNEQAKRLFAFIAVGGSVGGILGSTVTASFAEIVPEFSLLLLACIPLELASWCAGALHRGYGSRAGPRETADAPIKGNALSGIKVIFGSPYLLAIASYLALMTFSSTILYFQQAQLVGEAFVDDRLARTAFFARIDLAANALTILFQTLITVRLIRYLGVGLSLALVPMVAMLGFLSLGTYPLLIVLAVMQVLYTSGRHGVAKPAREILFTVVSREEKYKSKAFIDAAVYRGGDLVSGWLYAGLAAAGLSLAAIAFVAVPFAGAWVWIGLTLGKRQEVLLNQNPEPVQATG